MNKILSQFNIITQTTTPQNTILHTPILELEFKLRNLIAYSNSRQFPGPLAQLPSEKVALVPSFRCTEFELRTCVAIALNKVHASSMETMCIRAPLVTSSWAQTPTAQGPQLRAPAALQCVWFPGLGIYSLLILQGQPVCLDDYITSTLISFSHISLTTTTHTHKGSRESGDETICVAQ